MSNEYLGDIQQDHKMNIHLVVSLIDYAKKDGVDGIKHVSIEGRGRTVSKLKREEKVRIEGFLNKYSHYALLKKLHNVMCETERNSSLGSDSYTIKLLSANRKTLATVILQ